MGKNLYDILGITEKATAKEIKKAYRTKALKYHPDRNPNNKEAEEKFKELNEANDILSDPSKKQQYDMYGSLGNQQSRYSQQSGGFNPFNFDIFDMKNHFGSARHHNFNNEGNDKSIRLEISFEEAVFGVEKKIEIEKNKKCNDCEGSGAENEDSKIICGTCNGVGKTRMNFHDFFVDNTCQQCYGSGHIILNNCKKCRGSGEETYIKKLSINIPAGVNTNSKLRVAGEGDTNIKTGLSGNLYIHILVRPHSIFTRKNYDLYIEKEIDAFQAMIGCKIKIPLLNNEESGYILSIPPGTQFGTLFKLKDKGVQYVNGFIRGNLFVTIVVNTPNNLSSNQKEFLSKFYADLNNDPHESTDSTKKSV